MPRPHDLPRRRAMRAAWALALGGLFAAPTRAAAPAQSPPELVGLWPAVQLQGEGRLRFLGLLVYGARLWAPAPTLTADDWPQRDFALELTYARALVGRQIAERSLQEMRRTGPLPDDEGERWLEAMTALFPDVREGDRITGVHRPEQEARFFVNGRPRGAVRDGGFARRFFGIWLAPQTSQPQLRSALLGLG
jgi:hypothetical protein